MPDAIPAASEDLRSRGWEVTGGRLLIRGRPIAELLADHGSPLYVYDGRIVRARIRALIEAFPIWKPCYAVKANPNADVVGCIASTGVGLEVSSVGELASALNTGCAHIGVVGPGKSDELLRNAAAAEVSWLAAESPTDLARILKLRRTEATKILLRVNTLSEVSGARETMAGKPSQFGIDEEQVCDLMTSLPPGTIAGLHLYTGSQLLDPTDAAVAASALFATAQRLSVQSDTNWTHLVFGLGLGVPSNLSVGQASAALQLRRSLVEQNPGGLAAIESQRSSLEFDVGRFIVADAGMLLTRVVDVKVSRGETFVVVDSGMRSFARPMTPWGETHGLSVIDKADEAAQLRAHVVGPACLPGDVLARGVSLPAVIPGDVIAVHSTGAYGHSMSPLEWGSFGQTNEVFVDD